MSQVVPDPAPEYTLRQRFALLHRTLWREGYDDHIAGHISVRDGDTLLCTPHGLGWDEVRASDVLRIDASGTLIEGDGVVPTPITLHVVAHAQRPDVHVALHHHPRWATVWSAARRVPPIYDQLGSFGGQELVLYDDYSGAVDDVDAAQANVRALGGANCALLANHGVLVLGPSIEQVHLRALVVEHRCEVAYKVETLGGGQPLDPMAAAALGARTSELGWRGLWAAMVRREVRADSSVLE